MSKALFLDRDGTLIFDKHYLADPAGVTLIPGAAAAVHLARSLGYKLFVLTNQSGIGRGLYTMDDVLRCNARMDELLGPPFPIFEGMCIAPEASFQESRYRKPSPRYILESIERHQLDPAQCWMVGDRESDVQAGLNANIHSVAVCTGKHTVEEWSALALPGVSIFSNLPEFVATLR